MGYPVESSDSIHGPKTPPGVYSFIYHDALSRFYLVTTKPATKYPTLIQEVADLISRYSHILHQAVARAARHRLVQVSAAQSAAETRQLRKVQDVISSLGEPQRGSPREKCKKYRCVS